MKHIPTRTCCVCGKKDAPEFFLRVASQSGGAPQIGAKILGRGAYLCVTLSCLEKALHRKSFERALKLKNPLEGGFKDDLRTQILARQISSLAAPSARQGNID